MTVFSAGERKFRDWVDGRPDPLWSLLPLTHICDTLTAGKIAEKGYIDVLECPTFDKSKLAYCFYGRAAYRLNQKDIVAVGGVCPTCFILDPGILNDSAAIFPFDTGAFKNKLYKDSIPSNMDVLDFSLEADVRRPNRLIGSAFALCSDYIYGDVTNVRRPYDVALQHEHYPVAYFRLLWGLGRNESDDRLCAVEAIFDKPIPLTKNLRAVVVPHTEWSVGSGALWLQNLQSTGTAVSTYHFVPGRPPEHYHAHLEWAVIDLYRKWKLL